MGKTIFATDLASIELDLPQEFQWNGEDYPCCIDDSGRGEDGSMIGFSDDREISVVVRAGLFPLTNPTTGDNIKFDGRWYEINRVEKSPEGAALNMTATETK